MQDRRGPTFIGMAADDARLGLALSLARAAGRHALAGAGRCRVEWKGEGERVTNVDREVQALMVREVTPGSPAMACWPRKATPSGLRCREARRGARTGQPRKRCPSATSRVPRQGREFGAFERGTGLAPPRPHENR